MTDDLRQRYAEALAEKFTEPIYHPKPSGRVGETLMVHLVVGGRHQFWGVSCMEAAEVCAAVRDEEMTDLRERLDLADRLMKEMTGLTTLRQRADRAEAANGRVNALHSPYRIYEQCAHDEHRTGTQVVELGDDETCLIIPTLIVCRECCTDDEGQTAHCVDNHDHSNGWLCATLAALDEPEAHHG